MTLLKSYLNLLFLGIIFTFMVACGSETTTETTEETTEETPTPEPEAKPESARPVHWSYEAEDGPTKWGSLSPVYALCGNGQAQSPINIEKSDAKGEANWKLDHTTTSLKIAHTEHMEDILDNGHTIQVTVDEGSTFTFGDKSFDLKQFHFHTPSEHTVDGKHMPMEMHMVHQGADGSLAVVSVMFKEGKKANEDFAKIIANMPTSKGQTNHVKDIKFNLQASLPKDNAAYYYTGSLTTPPCSENVQWLVLRDPVTLTADQIKAFSSVIAPNNRPVQPLNGRTVSAGDLKGKVTN